MLLMIFVVFIDLLGFGIIIPLLPFYGLEFSPGHPFAITMLMATYSGFQLVAAPIWGRLSDRVGRRPIMLISLSTSVMAYLWLSHANALWMLFAARALQGVSAGNVSVAQAYIADITTPENRAKGMGAVGAAIGLGFSLGPGIGGWLAGSDPAHVAVTTPAYLAAALSLSALLTAIFRLKEPLSPEHRVQASSQRGRVGLIVDAFSRPRLRPVMILFFTSTFAFAAMEATYAQWAFDRLEWGPRQVGIAFAAVGAILIIIQGGLIGRLVKQFGEARLLLWGSITITAGLAGLAFTTTSWVALVCTCLLAMGQGAASPANASLVSREASALEQGGILGVNQSVGSLARLLGPACAGVAFEFSGAGGPYILGTCVMLIAVYLAYTLVRHRAADRTTMVTAQ